MLKELANSTHLVRALGVMHKSLTKRVIRLTHIGWGILSTAWREAFSLAWEALREGSIPIGAVVASSDDMVLSKGRNAIGKAESDWPLSGHQLAHAEFNALVNLKEWQKPDIYAYRIYTTVEPCPMCMGAIYMSGVRNIAFASRDPWAGSTNLLGTTPYLSLKPMAVTGPLEPVFEEFAAGLHMFHMLSSRRRPKFAEHCRGTLASAVSLAENWLRNGVIEQALDDGLDVEEFFNDVYMRV